MAIAVVVLANQYAGWLRPFIEWVLAHYLAMRHELLVLLATQQGTEVVVQPATAIMTLIHNHCVTIAILVAQQLAIYRAETLAVHRLHVNVSDATARNAIHDGAVSIHPALVEQLLLRSL